MAMYAYLLLHKGLQAHGAQSIIITMYSSKECTRSSSHYITKSMMLKAAMSTITRCHHTVANVVAIVLYCCSLRRRRRTHSTPVFSLVPIDQTARHKRPLRLIRTLNKMGNPRRDAVEYGILLAMTTSCAVACGIMLATNFNEDGKKKRVDLNETVDLGQAMKELRKFWSGAGGGGNGKK